MLLICCVLTRLLHSRGIVVYNTLHNIYSRMRTTQYASVIIGREGMWVCVCMCVRERDSTSVKSTTAVLLTDKRAPWGVIYVVGGWSSPLPSLHYAIFVCCLQTFQGGTITTTTTAHHTLLHCFHPLRPRLGRWTKYGYNSHKTRTESHTNT